MKIAADQIAARLRAAPGWSFDGSALVRKFAFPSFPDAVSFVSRLAFDAQSADHHPDLLLSYKHVTVTWTTHSDGGVTDKDFTGASQSDAIAHRFGGSGSAG